MYLYNKSGDVLKGSEFMLYSLTSIFKDKELDDIERGIVDSSYREYLYDFGIDAIFISASNEFVEQVEQLEDCNEDTKFKIQIFQFKRGTGVGQADLLKLSSGIQRVLIDEDVHDDDNLYFYNRMLVLNEIKHQIYSKFPSENVTVQCHLVFGGLEINVQNDALIQNELLKIQNLIITNGYAKYQLCISDCQALINAPSKMEEVVDVIEYQKTFKYITETDDQNKLNGYISIVNGKDIAELVRKHQSSIFEANIRDYYKRSDLNSKILETSASEDEAKFFWSYNNGLTMTCSRVEDLPNNKYRLHNIQIVNGCQTSNAIYLALKTRKGWKN